MDRERDRGTGGKEFEKIYRTDSWVFFSPLYKCFSNWNLRHHRNQRRYKWGIKTLIIIDLMLNVGTYLIVSILIQCSSLSVFKSGDQKSWVYSKSKSDSLSDPPAPLTAECSLGSTLQRSHHWDVSFSTLPFHPRVCRTLFSSNAVTTTVPQKRLRSKLLLTLKMGLYRKIYFQMRNYPGKNQQNVPG